MQMHAFLGCKIVAHHRLGVSRVQFPNRVEYARLIDGHSQALAKMLGPR